MSDVAVANPALVINNVAIPVMPNSVSFTEGFGEQSQRVQSAGGGNVDVVYSDDVTTHTSSLKFSMLNTEANIELIRSWKANRNQNAATLTGSNNGGAMTRNFADLAVTNDYEVNLGADAEITIECISSPAS